MLSDGFSNTEIIDLKGVGNHQTHQVLRCLRQSNNKQQTEPSKLAWKRNK